MNDYIDFLRIWSLFCIYYNYGSTTVLFKVDCAAKTPFSFCCIRLWALGAELLNPTNCELFYVFIGVLNWTFPLFK